MVYRTTQSISKCKYIVMIAERKREETQSTSKCKYIVMIAERKREETDGLESSVIGTHTRTHALRQL